MEFEEREVEEDVEEDVEDSLYEYHVHADPDGSICIDILPA